VAVTATNLIAGPGALYLGDFGATEPADAVAVPGVAFTEVGATQDGVTINIAQEFFELEIDQVTDVIGRRTVKRDVRVSTNLAEPTIENLAVVLNGGTSGVGGTGSTAFKSYEPIVDNSATQPTYKALLFDGWAPNQKNRRVIVRKVLSIESVDVAYKKAEMTLYPVTFGAHWVSSSIKTFKVMDATPA
jgi:hypothetical protein